jgi:hypothetical protein
MRSEHDSDLTNEGTDDTSDHPMTVEPVSEDRWFRKANAVILLAGGIFYMIYAYPVTFSFILFEPLPMWYYFRFYIPLSISIFCFIGSYEALKKTDWTFQILALVLLWILALALLLFFVFTLLIVMIMYWYLRLFEKRRGNFHPYLISLLSFFGFINSIIGILYLYAPTH